VALRYIVERVQDDADSDSEPFPRRRHLRGLTPRKGRHTQLCAAPPHVSRTQDEGRIFARSTATATVRSRLRIHRRRPSPLRAGSSCPRHLATGASSALGGDSPPPPPSSHLPLLHPLHHHRVPVTVALARHLPLIHGQPRSNTPQPFPPHPLPLHRSLSSTTSGLHFTPTSHHANDDLPQRRLHHRARRRVARGLPRRRHGRAAPRGGRQRRLKSPW